MPQSTGIGLRRDSRTIIVNLLRTSSAALTTPQIEARTGLSHSPTMRHLAALEEAGQIGRIAGKPNRWYLRADATERADSGEDAAD